MDEIEIDTILKVIGIIMGSIITFSAFVAAIVYLLNQHKKSTRELYYKVVLYHV